MHVCECAPVLNHRANGPPPPPQDSIRIEEMINYFSYDLSAGCAGCAGCPLRSSTGAAPRSAEISSIALACRPPRSRRPKPPTPRDVRLLGQESSNLVVLNRRLRSPSGHAGTCLLLEELSSTCWRTNDGKRTKVSIVTDAGGIRNRPTAHQRRRKGRDSSGSIDSLHDGRHKNGGEPVF